MDLGVSLMSRGDASSGPRVREEGERRGTPSLDDVVLSALFVEEETEEEEEETEGEETEGDEDGAAAVESRAREVRRSSR